jgi:hypothetical protein
MILQYGDGAATRAVARAIELRAAGSLAAADTWLRVREAIDRLQAEKPAPGETVQ